MTKDLNLSQAFQQGQQAYQGAHNPYSQREGEPWHVENQDEMFDAWRRGYYSVLHAELCRCDGCKEYYPQSGEEVLSHAIRHIRRVHMNCRTWTLPVGDSQAIDLMQNIREAELDNCIAEFDRINHGPFEHPVSE